MQILVEVASPCPPPQAAPPRAAGHGPSTRIRASRCEGTSGVAGDTGIRTIRLDVEISYRRPPTSDWSKQRRIGWLRLTLVASLELPMPRLSVLLLRCRTFPPWHHWDDTWPERWASMGACPRREGSGKLVCDLRCQKEKWSLTQRGQQLPLTLALSGPQTSISSPVSPKLVSG